jgi:isochorismate synthase
MKAVLDEINRQLSAKLPFAVYRKPGENKVTGIFQKDKTTYFADDFSQPGFVFAPFSGHEVLCIPKDVSQVFTAEFIPTPINATSPLPEFDEAGKQAYELLVEKGITAIKAGEFDKLVLSRMQKFAVPDFDATALFDKLASAYPLAFVYLWYHPVNGIWLAATPEKLLSINQSKFKTMALAGTQPFEGSAQVAWQNKEKSEQQFVTDFIARSVAGFTTGLVVSAPYTVQAGNLLHIRTDIEGDIKPGTGIKEIISALHPTPAVCGLPKMKAMEFILEHEGYQREYYSGFLGEINRNNETDLYVNLRCMKIENDEAQLFMGCGITRDSDPQKEYIETVNKSLTLRKVIDN